MKTPSTLRRFAIRSVLALLLSISIVASVTFAVAWPAAPAGEAPFGKIGTMFKSFFTGTDWAGGRVTIGDSAAVDPVSSRVQIKGLGTTSATAGLNVTNSSGVSTFKVNDDGSITASGAITAPSFVGGVTDSRVNGLSTSYIPKWNGSSLADSALYESANTKLIVKGSDTTSSNFGLNVTDSAGASKFLVRNDGNVGIGTATPSSTLGYSGPLLHIYGAQPALILQNTDGVAGAAKWEIGTNWFGAGPTPTLTLGVGATYAMAIQSTGSVGIGTTGPNAKLSLGSDATAQKLLLYDSGNVRGGFGIQSGEIRNFIWDTAQNGFTFGTVSITDGSTWSEKVRITTDGNVGIGTTNPGAKLNTAVTYSASAIVPALKLATLSGYDSNGSGTSIDFGMDQANNPTWVTGRIASGYTTGTGWGGDLVFSTNNNGSATSLSERMRINSAGNVGIGTTAPQAKLNVVPGNGVEGVRVSGSSNTLGLSLAYTDSATTHAYISNLYSGNAASDIQFQFGSTLGSGTVMTLLQSGNVGIGTASPAADFELARLTNAELRVSATDGLNDRAAKLSLRGSGNGGALLGGAIIDFTDTDGTPATPGSLTFQKSGSSYLTILDGGNVGIGTTGPIAKLQVSSAGTNNSITTNILSEITGTFTAGQRVGLGSSLDFRNDTGVNYARIGAYCDTDCTNNQGALGFWTESVATTFTTSNPRMVINSSGNVGIGTASPRKLLEVSGAGDARIGFTDTNAAADNKFWLLGPVGTSFLGKTVDDANNISRTWLNVTRSGTAISSIVFATNTGTTALTLDSSQQALFTGNVGIGTSAPGGYRTAIRGSGDTSATGSLWVSGATAVTPGLMVRDDGNVGIGTVTPAYTLDVNGAINATSVLVNGVAIGGGSQWTTNGSNIYYNAGNVGIGTTSPSFDANAASNATYLTLQSASTLSEIGVSLNQTSTTGYLGGYAFVNAGLAATEKRNAVILGANDGATNSGNMQFWTSSAGTLSERMRIDSSGNVGIGTTAADFKLTIDAVSGGNGLKVQSSNANALLRVTNIAVGGDFLDIEPDTTGANIQMNDANVLRLDTSGNVGIGTTAPNDKLEVSGTGSTFGIRATGDGISSLKLYSTNANVGTRNWILATNHTAFGDLNIMQSSTQGGDPLAGTSRIYLGNSGNIGIGTTNPQAKLSLVGGSTLRFGNDGDSGENMIYLRGGASGDKSTIRLNHYGFADWEIASGWAGDGKFSITNTQGGTDGIVIDTVGNVGIGTTTPKAKLQVGTSLSLDGAGAASLGYNFYNDGSWKYASTDESSLMQGDSGGNIHFYTAASGTIDTAIPWGAAKFSILNNGNVGIGTASPVNKLFVEDNSTAAAVYIQQKGAGDIFAVSSGATGYGTERFRITNGGNVGIGTINPVHKLQIDAPNGTFAQGLRLSYNNNAYGHSLVTGTDSKLYIGRGSSGSESVSAVIDTYGNVGIGTTVPGSLLELKKTLAANTTNENLLTLWANFGSATSDNFGSAIAFKNHTAGNDDYEIAKIAANSSSGDNDGYLRFYTRRNAVTYYERMVIDRDGNVGIGTITPGVKLQLLGAVAAIAPGTEEQLKLTRSIAGGVSYPQAASFALGSYSTNNVGNSYGPDTRLDIKLKSTSADDFQTDATVMTLQDNGNVGIGTSAPGGYRTAIRGSGDTSATGALWVSGATAVTPGLMVRDDGNVGIGTTAPDTSLVVNGTGRFMSANPQTPTGGTSVEIRYAASTYSNSPSGYVTSYDRTASAYKPLTLDASTIYLSTSGTNAMTLTGGNVSVGTAASAGTYGTLESWTAVASGASVPGNIAAIDTTAMAAGVGGQVTYAGQYINGIYTYAAYTRAVKENATSGEYGFGLALGTRANGGSLGEVMRLTSTGNVGIGTTSPGQKLEVYSSGYAGATNFATKNIKVNSGFVGGYTAGTIVSLLTSYDGTVYATDIGHEYDNTGYGLTFSTNSTTSGNPSERMRIDHSGNVGIGTTTPGYKLDVQGGGVNASGGYTQTSDIRLKTNIEYLNSKDSLRKIISLRGIHFNWKDEKKLGSDRQIGIIAQDVQKVFPEAVKTDTEGYLSVSYSNLVVPLIEAVKELSSKAGHLENRIEELFAKYLDQQDEINTLKLQNQSFEKRLQRLEQRLN